MAVGKISLPVGVLTMSSRRDIVQIAYALQPAPAPPAGVARVDVRFVFCSPAQRFTSTCCCSTALRTWTTTEKTPPWILLGEAGRCKSAFH
jgi:hypothetical protein